MALPHYEVYALRYATSQGRSRSENFISTDRHDAPMPIDYFVWIIRGEGRTILVDTGFNLAAAQARKREFLRCPVQSLSLLGIKPEDIDDVVLTHMHYDHAGNIKLLPTARLHVQESEIHYCCGSDMTFGIFRHAYAVADVLDVVQGVYDQRVTFYKGDARIAPGIELLLIGGHTKGLQSVRVHTARGWIVLASDATHFYENLERQSPFPIVHNVGDMLRGYDILKQNADSPDHIVPGHDPQVLACYPSHPASAEIACLHQAPHHRPS